MRQIVKWTLLCLIGAACGFGATLLIADNPRVAQTLAAMLPAQPAPGQLETAALPPVDVALDQAGLAAAGPVRR